jgi:hypothetical protein
MRPGGAIVKRGAVVPPPTISNLIGRLFPLDDYRCAG